MDSSGVLRNDNREYKTEKGVTMATQHNPDNPDQQAPDPATIYGREKPEAESGQGRLTNNRGTPTHRTDQIPDAVHHKQPPRQINADDPAASAHRAGPDAHLPPPEPVDHSMNEEEPDGWDLAPIEHKPKRDRRHPRTEGKGGTP
jgi:hypothetical protein